MKIQQIIICVFLLISVAQAASLSIAKVRQKRTLQYFFDGLFSVVNNRNSTTRASNDHKLSPLVTFSKLSSFSTQARDTQTLEDDNDNETSAENFKRPKKEQLTIPTTTKATIQNEKKYLNKNINEVTTPSTEMSTIHSNISTLLPTITNEQSTTTENTGNKTERRRLDIRDCEETDCHNHLVAFVPITEFKYDLKNQNYYKSSNVVMECRLKN